MTKEIVFLSDLIVVFMQNHGQGRPVQFGLDHVSSGWKVFPVSAMHMFMNTMDLPNIFNREKCDT